MKINLKFPILLALLSLLILPVRPAYAQGTGPGGGQVIFGRNFTIESGESYDGDLVVFGGNVTVEENADLNGNLVVFGGTISSEGNVSGDVVVMGGQVQLEENAVVGGDLVLIGGQVDRADGAVVEGEVVNNVAPEVVIPSGRIPPEVVVPEVVPPRVNVDFGPFFDYFQMVGWILGITALSMLLMLFWQAPLERAGNTIVTQPLMSGAIGLVATVAGVIFFITIVPPIVVAFAWLFGLVAMGREVGERFAAAINQRWTPVITAGTGTFLLMVVGSVVGAIPCLGAIVLFVLGLLGVGGAISTWFNLQPALRPNVTVYTPPSDSGEVPPAS